MVRLIIEHRAKQLALLCGGLLLLVALTPAVAADDDDGTTTGPETITDLGLAFDWHFLRSPAGSDEELQRMEARIKTLLDGKLSDREKKAARYLWAEVKLALGKNREAEELFKKAEHDYKKGSFADDAAYLRVLSIESEGRDDDAAREWEKWLKRYTNSPLTSAVYIAKCWNEIRRDSVRLAARTLSELESRFPYAAQDPRSRLAKATVAYLQGTPAVALQILGAKPTTAAEFYLAGLCYEANGAMLKAAAHFQRVFERFPASPLRDHAMLAKANVFLASGGYESASEEYTRVIETASNEDVKAEASVRRAACRFLVDDSEGSTALLREVVVTYRGEIYAARAQLLLGEVLFSRSMHEEAIIEFNRVLSNYFEHELAASAQYQVGRCLDALGRRIEAITAYQLVVSGYPLAPQAPAAAYLAGAGLLDEERPVDATPYFQLVLDRYAREGGQGELVFDSPEKQELVEAALCLLELSYHRAGDLGQLSGVPHLMLQKMPPSDSTWRAYALLIDADALAAQGRHDEAQAVLQALIKDFPEHQVDLPANRLLAWTYAQQGKDELAIQVEERMLARFSVADAQAELSSAYINKAHILFNNKKYKDAAAAYDDFFYRYPSHSDRLLALYQAGLCYYRLQQSGDAVDRWEALVEEDPASDMAERAWVRAGDLYFQAEYYDEAKRAYQGLLENFANSHGMALGMLRLAQCEFNAGNDKEALRLYSDVFERFPGTGIAREAEKGMEVALYRLGQSDEGSELLAELVEQYPTSAFAADAQFEIAMRHYDAEAFEAAAQEFRRVVSQFPEYSAADRAHFLMAESFNQAGKAQESKNGYEQFLVFFPESEFQSTVRFRLGTIRFADGDFMQAAVEFSSVVEDDAPDEMKKASLFNLALCQKVIGDSQGAKTALESFIDKYPGDGQIADARYQLGDIHEKAGDWKTAAAEYKKAITAKPSFELKVELFYRLGVCQEGLEDVDGAIAYYEKAIKSKLASDAFRLSAVVRCAALYEKKGEYKKAITAYRDLINHAEDGELVAAAREREAQLEGIVK